MTDEVKVLNSRDAIPAGITPTGVTHKVFREGEVALYEVFPVREDEFGKQYPDKSRKQIVFGTFTSEQRAAEALRRQLCVLWSESDALAQKLANRERTKAA